VLGLALCGGFFPLFLFLLPLLEVLETDHLIAQVALLCFLTPLLILQFFDFQLEFLMLMVGLGEDVELFVHIFSVFLHEGSHFE